MTEQKKHIFSIEGLIKENNQVIKEEQDLIKTNEGIIVQLEQSSTGNPLEVLRCQREILLLKIENRQLKGSIEAKQNYNSKWTDHANK